MYYRFLRFPDGRPKAVTFSYDDASRHDIRLLETMNKYGIKCTLNINNFVLDEQKRDSRLMPEEIREHVLAKGHEITVHCASHRAPGRLRAIEGIREVLDCRLALEKEFGGIIRGMAYPDSGITKMSPGMTKEIVKNYLKELDIVYARSLRGDNNLFELPEDWLEWIPTAHHDNPEIFNYIDKFVSIDPEGGYRSSLYPRLFYVWGHSHEFANNDNWERLEEICKRLAGHDDTWYATNMEIYNYTQAYNSLIFSADSMTVYNPTLVTVWFSANGITYKIDSGETITLK